MRIPGLLPLFLALAALTPAARAELPQGPLPLTDEETKMRMTREEGVAWGKIEKLAEAARRDLAKGQALQKPSRALLAGPAEESAEARKARGDTIVNDATRRLEEIGKKFDEIRAAAAGRMNAEARKARCPSLALADALKKGAADITAAAKAAGYEHLAVAGVFVASGDSVVADSGFTNAFIAAFSPDENTKPELPLDGTPNFDGAKLTTVSPKTGVVVAEMHPMKGFSEFDGMLWTVRLTDPATMTVKHAYLAYVLPEKNMYGAPVAFDATLLDRRAFLDKLGPVADWPFALEGFGVAPALLRAALLKGEKPPLEDIPFFLSASRSSAKDKLGKATWKIESKEGRHRVFCRPVGSPASAAVDMGELVFAPAPLEGQ